MRDASPLSIAAPPASQDVSIPGCEDAHEDKACQWETARSLMQRAIDPHFTLIEPIPARPGGR
jgi:hypothetical protein